MLQLLYPQYPFNRTQCEPHSHLDILEREKNLDPARKQTLGCPAYRLVTHYTDYTMLTPSAHVYVQYVREK